MLTLVISQLEECPCADHGPTTLCLGIAPSHVISKQNAGSELSFGHKSTFSPRLPVSPIKPSFLLPNTCLSVLIS